MGSGQTWQGIGNGGAAVGSVASCGLVLHGIVLCPSSSPPPRHAPWGVLACARVGGCRVSFVAYCHPPIVVSRCCCLSHRAVVISLPILSSFPSLPFPHPRCSHHSPFPPYKQLLVAVVGGVMWWLLSSWPSLFVSGRSMFIWCAEGVWSVIASCRKHKR